MNNRRCPRCQAHYDPPARFCTRDGTPLVEVAAAVPPRPSERRTRPPTPRGADARDTTGRQSSHTPRFPDLDPSPVDPAESARFGSLTGVVLDGEYLVGHKIGEGGMSWVYQGTEQATDRTVAIKVLPPRLSRDADSVERLRREAELAMRLEHPNVCAILRFGRTADGILYLVMPFLAGETLGDFEGRTREVPLEQGLTILAQVARGLQHAHDAGVVHRDLKPENVMLVPDGIMGETTRAVVMDFGLAKERRAGPEVVKLTQTGIVLGTPEFMSPEQIRGRPLDGRSDIYALGVLAFELFTGALPFSGKNAQETMVARLRGLPRQIREIRPELPSRLEAVINRALALVPDDRYQSMDEFAHALEGVPQSGMFARLFRRKG